MASYFCPSHLFKHLTECFFPIKVDTLGSRYLLREHNFTLSADPNYLFHSRTLLCLILCTPAGNKTLRHDDGEELYLVLKIRSRSRFKIVSQNRMNLKKLNFSMLILTNIFYNICSNVFHGKRILF